MPGQFDCSDLNPPQQLSLPECSISKTRRRSGQPLRRVKATKSLVIPAMPADVVEILKAQAKRRNMTYTEYCKEALQLHAYHALNPIRGRR